MAQKVRIIPATINRATSAPIDAKAKRKVAGYVCRLEPYIALNN